MAKLSADKKYVTVEKGDSLWAIAAKFLGSGTKYPSLAKWNNISKPYTIYVNQKIYITADGSSSGSSSSSTKKNDNKVTITHFGEQSTEDNSLLVMWTWSKEKETESYKILWSYKTADGIWLSENLASNSVDKEAPEVSRHHTYNIPKGAVEVKVKVKPIAKTETKDNKETSPWTAEWSTVNDKTTWKAGSAGDLLPTGPSLSPTIENDKLTATVEDIATDGNPKQVEFEVRKNEESKATYQNKSNITSTRVASYSWNVSPGNSYRVRARYVRDKVTGEWGPWSDKQISSPVAPKSITKIEPRQDESRNVTEVYLEWSEVGNADGYEIAWYLNKNDINLGRDPAGTKNVDRDGVSKPPTKTLIDGLGSGQEYFFRVRCKVGSNVSTWTGLKSVVLGRAPNAPTTWSSATTVIVGESVTLYWVHNSADGSKETYGDLEIYSNGQKIPTNSIPKQTSDDGKETTSLYVLDTTKNAILFTEGSKITWRARTKGIIDSWGEWSDTREIDVYAQPSMVVHVSDKDDNDVSRDNPLTSFPLAVTASPEREYTNQKPISYSVTITANESYETVDNVGNDKTVKMGDTVYSKFVDAKSVDLELTPGDIDLENNILYTVTVKMAMSSGLTQTESRDFIVSWQDEVYTPTAEIGIDTNALTAQIRPYCEDSTTTLYAVTESGDTFTKTDTVLSDIIPITSLTYRYDGDFTEEEVAIEGDGVFYRYVKGIPVYKGTAITYNADTDTIVREENVQYWEKTFVTDKLTTTGEAVLYGETSDGDRIYYCEVTTTTVVEDIFLSVYRREFDGSFTLIAEGLENVKGTTVTDPHPALDYARYRIVAVSKQTGAVSYSDLAGYPVGGKAVIIQWDEEWVPFDIHEETALEQPAWTGSLLRLPYNIDVSDSTSLDVTLVSYVGRSHPVSYYGTHVGQTADWSVVVPKDDEETIYALRRLSRWMGDVYVREPSGTGYWANIAVSFSQTHCNPSVPVKLKITRVEGGM